MSNNLDAMNIQLSDAPRSDRAAGGQGAPRDRSAKEMFRKGTDIAGSQWQRSKKNLSKLITFKQEDFNLQHQGQRILSPDENDQKVYQLITQVPKVPSPWCYVCLILNLFIPGLGTIISSCFARPCSKTQLFVGLLQFYTAAFIIGWIMSIYWGILIFVASTKPESSANLSNISSTQASTTQQNQSRQI